MPSLVWMLIFMQKMAASSVTYQFPFDRQEVRVLGSPAYRLRVGLTRPPLTRVSGSD